MSTIPETTRQILAQSTYRVVQPPYAWVRAGDVGDPASHLMVVRDERETTVVTHEANLTSVEVLDRNPDLWVLLSIDCANPFYCVGFIAAIAEAFVARGLDILVLSTFSRDLIFVKESEVNAAHEALSEVGVQRAS